MNYSPNEETPNPNEVLIIQKLRAIDIKLDNIECSGNGDDTTDYEAIVQEEYDEGVDPVPIDFTENIEDEYTT